jgi:hypothetical protein
MTHTEYQRKRTLIRAYEALPQNTAWLEVRAKIEEELANCLRGLRNRKIPMAERQEFQEGADLAERLLAYPEERVKALTKEITLRPEELEQLSTGFEGES